jgi:hypothetical protein
MDVRVGQRFEPALVLILSIVTFGIYYLFYIARVSQETQEFLGEPDTSPGLEVLLTVLTCYLYNCYWDYKMGHKIAKMQQRAGLRVVDNSALYLILDIVGFGVFNSMIQQTHLNEIWYAAGSNRIAR